MKQIISILISVALCVVGVNCTVFAEENKSSIVYIENATGAIGETVDVPIGIKNNQGVISLVTEISYDNTALKLLEVKKDADFWQSANMTPGGDLNAQPYRIIWYDGLAKSNFTGNGTLAVLTFGIIKEGSHKIELSVSDGDTFNSSFDSVPFEVCNGVIDVPSASVTTAPATTTVTTTSKVITTTIETTTTVVTTEKVTETTTTAIVTNANNSGKLCLNNVSGTVGETLSIPINIQNNPGIISLVAEISYDNSALKLVDVKKNSEFWKDSTMTPGGDLSAQPYRIIWYDGLAKNDFTENGQLAELTFEVLKSGSHKVELSVSDTDTFNSNFVPVLLEVKYGIIDCTSESTTTESNIASDDDLCNWAIIDYQSKTGITAAKAEITSKDDNYEITLTDENGDVLDIYTIDPVTGIGTSKDGNEVNLPQTGNNSIDSVAIASTALAFVILGLCAIAKSGVLRRKKDEQ